MATRQQDPHQHQRRRQSQHHRPPSVAATTKAAKRPRSMRFSKSDSATTTPHSQTEDEPRDTALTTNETTTTTTILSLWEPHVAFGIGALAVKFLCPALLKWLAHDSIVTLIVSVWIPLGYTVAVIHQTKQQQQQQQQEPQHSKSSSNDERRFWLRYWSLGFAVAQFVRRLMQLTPLLYQAGLQYPHIPVLLDEIQFLFVVWTFALNRTVLNAYRRYRYPLNHYWRRQHDGDDQEERWLADDSEPLSLMDNLVRPHLLQLQAVISEPIPKETWQRYIHSKAQRVLDLLVVLQFLTEEWREYLLLLLDEGRSLLVLSVFLVLPSSLTQIGIVYAKYVLPSARSCSTTTAGGSGEDELLHLQYWVLNVVLSSFLAGGSWLYWFLPFSTQIIFATWCYFTFPRTIREYYAVLEMELIAFGLLSGESQLALQETKTVKALRALVKRIPSANDAEGFRWADSEDDSDNDSDNDEQDSDNDDSASVASHRRRQRKAKAKVRRALGSRTKSSPSALKTFTPSARQQTVNEEEKDIDDEDGRTQNDFAPRRASEQMLPPSLSGIEESDDSSVAAVCNVDVSSSHDSSEGGPKNLSSGAHLLESISSFQDQSVITTTRSAASDDAMVVNGPMSRMTLSSPSTHSVAEPDESSHHGYASDMYFSEMDTGSSAENLEIAPSFESHFDGGHYFDGSIRDLRRSLNGGGTSPIQQATRRSERVRNQQRSQLQQPQVHPGYLQPTESSRRSRHVRLEEYENESSRLLHEVLSSSRRLRQTSRRVRENDKMDDDIDDQDYEPMVGRIQSPGEPSTSSSSPRKARQRRPCRDYDEF